MILKLSLVAKYRRSKENQTARLRLQINNVKAFGESKMDLIDDNVKVGRVEMIQSAFIFTGIQESICVASNDYVDIWNILCYRNIHVNPRMPECNELIDSLCFMTVNLSTNCSDLVFKFDVLSRI